MHYCDIFVYWIWIVDWTFPFTNDILPEMNLIGMKISEFNLSVVIYPAFYFFRLCQALYQFIWRLFIMYESKMYPFLEFYIFEMSLIYW